MLWIVWASLVAQLVKSLPAVQETQFNSWVRKIHWRRDRLPSLVFLGFPGGSAGKESACNVGDLGLIPGLGRSPGEGNSYPLQYCGLENSMDCIVPGVAKSRTRLSASTFSFFFLSCDLKQGAKSAYFRFCIWGLYWSTMPVWRFKPF